MAQFNPGVQMVNASEIMTLKGDFRRDLRRDFGRGLWRRKGTLEGDFGTELQRVQTLLAPSIALLRRAAA